MKTADVLALPEKSIANAYDVYRATVKPNQAPLVFTSEIAPIVENNIIRLGGNGQSIIPKTSALQFERVDLTGKLSRRSGIEVIDRAGNGYAASFTKQDFLQNVADNSISFKSYEQVGKQGVDIRFIFDDRVKDLGTYYPSKKIIELYPKNIEFEAIERGFDPAKYAARIFSHEAKHVRRDSLGLLTNTRADEYLSYRREYLFQEKKRPTLDKRFELWQDVKRDYPDLPVGNAPIQWWSNL